MDRLAIIDGDPIVYSVAYALQQYALSDLTCNGHIVELFDSKKEAKLHAFDIGLEEDEYEILPYSDATDDDIAEYLTYSIADGMGLGFITYVLGKALAGRVREIHIAVWLIAALFAVRFALL